MNLRPYQQAAIDSIPESGSYLIQMATGLGKTVTFSNITRRGRMLILSHREELVNQPKKYFDCSFGIEQGKNKSNGEEVVSASVMSLVRRLDRFKPYDFDIIICDEAHRATSPSYLKIFDYFKPRLNLGFTATPNRSDGKGLNKIYEKIIYQKDLKWGITNNYLSSLECLRVDIGYDLSSIKQRIEDFSIGELEKVVNDNKINKAIKEVYNKYAVGQTMIFACSVCHAENLSKIIDQSVVVSGKTANRSEIINKFEKKEIKCIINCMVYTEGTDIPCLETIIIARPTSSKLLYIQMVGRGLRLYPGKEKALLIDCVGNTGKHDLCSAPTLLGIDTTNVPKECQNRISGDLFDLEEIILKNSDVPESWIKNVQVVKMWENNNKFNLHNINFFKHPNGTLSLTMPGNKQISLNPVNNLGQIDSRPAQEVFDEVYSQLNKEYTQYKYIWDISIAKKWGRSSASLSQKGLISRMLPKYKTEFLSKMEASLILNRLLFRYKKKEEKENEK